jgi:hypothetical protein
MGSPNLGSGPCRATMAREGNGPMDFLEIWFRGEARLIPLDRGRLTVGRAPENNIELADGEASAVHAVFERLASSWCIRDLASTNGTTVNGERLSGERRLRRGDEIRIGRARLVYRPESSASHPPTSVATHVPDVTARERDVLIALFGGRIPGEVFFEPAATADVARTLGVSSAAVKQHLLHLYDKFGLVGGQERTRARLANEALRRGVLTLAELRAAAGP